MRSTGSGRDLSPTVQHEAGEWNRRQPPFATFLDRANGPSILCIDTVFVAIGALPSIVFNFLGLDLAVEYREELHRLLSSLYLLSRFAAPPATMVAAAATIVRGGGVNLDAWVDVLVVGGGFHMHPAGPSISPEN